jgi:hypothetical protein
MTGRVAYIVLMLLASALTGCSVSGGRPAPSSPQATVEVTEDPVPLEWKSVATPTDQQRLATVPATWRTALAAAQRFRSAIREEGPLLDPDAALLRAAPTPGPYLCRVVKLGARPAIIAFRPFHCFIEIEGELLTFVKASGSQRPAGRLWADGDKRMVFLGAMGVGNEEPPAYGQHSDRDMAGHVERIGPFRWRLVIPDPAGSILDVYELVPFIPLEP